MRICDVKECKQPALATHKLKPCETGNQTLDLCLTHDKTFMADVTKLLNPHQTRL